MNYGEVLNAFSLLRVRLAIHVGQEALPQITVASPISTDDEFSFVRLVSWAYVLMYETGRIPFGYLRQLPPWNQPSSVLLPHIRALRTWTSHNLALDEDADLATLRDAIAWFNRTCGTGTPATQTHWQQCFTTLCNDLVTVLNCAISACDAFEKPDDRDRLIDGLKKRLDRNWAAYRFDKVVSEAIERFGYRGIDVVKFRSRHLDAWRKIVAASLESDLDRNLRLRVETDILAMMGEALPITAEEFEALTAVTEKQAMVSMLLSLRCTPPASRMEVIDVLTIEN